MSNKNIVFFIITTCFTLLITLIVGEICIRLFVTPHVIPAPPPPSNFNPYRSNDYIVNMRPYSYFHIPESRYSQKLALYSNEYSINSMGFRGNNFTTKPSGNKQRLAVIGDSIVEGHGVQPEQTFTYHLQNKLAESDWEVINLGVQGASPLYFAANLERYLYLNPDAVLLMIHENDLYEDELREKSYFSLPVLENRETLYSGGTLHSWYEKSRLFSFLKATQQQLSRTPLEKIIESNSQIPGRADEDQKSSQQKSSFVVPSSKIDKRWEMSQKYLTYVIETLQSRDIDLLVTSLCTVTLAFHKVQEYTTHCSNVEIGVKQWADQHSVPYLSLIPSMKKALWEHKNTDVLIFNDYHPTPMAHRMLADELYPFVLNRLTGGITPEPVSE